MLLYNQHMIKFMPSKNRVDKTMVAKFNSKVADQAIVQVIGDSESEIRPI